MSDVEAAIKPVVIDQQVAPALFGDTPEDVVAMGARIARCLGDIIEKQELFTVIQGKKYILVEGWSTLGGILNVNPKEDWVKELEDGSYEAYVNLINSRTGTVVGGASALCGTDERRWSRADRYARRSMAVTRATGKAFRLAYPWIPVLAGYQSTPAEEMPVPTNTLETAKSNVYFKKEISAILAKTSNQDLKNKVLQLMQSAGTDTERLSEILTKLRSKEQ